MLRSIDEVRSALGAPIAQREFVELEVPGSPSAIAVRIEPAELMAVWQRARERVELTGRWPVAMTTWLEPGPWSHQLAAAKLFDRWAFSESGDDALPHAIIARAAEVDLESFVHALIDRSPFFENASDAGGVPALDWFEPPADRATALVLLPTSRSWESLAYHAWYAMDGQPSAPFLALLRSWESRYGAELVAHWGTMLQLVVARPPGTMAEAAALAREHVAVAPCTMALPGLSLASYARALVGRTTWFLHERP